MSITKPKMYKAYKHGRRASGDTTYDIFVKSIEGKTLIVEVRDNDYVEDIKEKVKKHTGTRRAASTQVERQDS